MTRIDTIISTIGYLETGIECIRRHEKKEITLDFACIAIEVAMLKAKKNLLWLALMEKVGDA